MSGLAVVTLPGVDMESLLSVIIFLVGAFRNVHVARGGGQNCKGGSVGLRRNIWLEVGDYGNSEKMPRKIPKKSLSPRNYPGYPRLVCPDGKCPGGRGPLIPLGLTPYSNPNMLPSPPSSLLQSALRFKSLGAIKIWHPDS